MKFAIFTSLLLVGADKCPAITDNCGDTLVPANTKFTQTVTFYSEPGFKGQAANASISGLYGCTNMMPGFQIKSMLSTASTMMVLHYGPDCAGHVVADHRTNFGGMKPEEGCAKSLFIKAHRKGSC
ncbi:hypothetical protein DSO57_1016201 [Entomophthora muscae]|uniref:Uncharacterized protein n=2 Tax=Entomophthora muscae TaxID=34485 RepID=A0ACC2UQJ9_9FUNG|nr:hypothetical protein DSO57_1004534 [Entomophthora muscae]KAJ9089103.1 hypothetical protein DSO57_1016201 [Entomophthora muscae]